MFFGLGSTHSLPMVEGDDIYTTSNMGRLYGDDETRSSSSHYRRKLEKSMNQYDISIDENNFVITSSMPLVAIADFPHTSMPEHHESMEMHSHEKSMPSRPRMPEHHESMEMNHHEEPMREETPQYGTPAWYEKMHSKLNAFSQEAFMFMQSGLTIVSDFDTLRVPTSMKRENLSKLFSRFREQSMSFMDGSSFGVRDEARQLLEEYIAQSDLSLIPPQFMLEEQSRLSYYRSIFFNTSRIESQGTGKLVLPRTKPYSTWLATGFALNAKSGLSIAQPVRLPTSQGLYVLGECPRQVLVGENVLLKWGANNYLGKDLSNVMFRIRASPDFDLMEESRPQQIISMKDKDYTFTIPSLKSWGVETRSMIFVPKRCGIMQIVMEIECEFGGDYEVLTVHVHEAGITRKELKARLFDLTSDKKTYGPIVEKITESPNLREVAFSVSGKLIEKKFHLFFCIQI
jgi:hypothetical protein